MLLIITAFNYTGDSVVTVPDETNETNETFNQTGGGEQTDEPTIEEDVGIVVNEKDIRIDTYRAGGAGGQHVNKTSSAVRITHVPTGVVVQCQNERSQGQNREQAMKIVRAKLLQKKQEEDAATLKSLKGATQSADFGSQIRSYVLHPYKMVKDLRTDVERSDPENVLDGDLDDFITAELRRSGGS